MSNSTKTSPPYKSRAAFLTHGMIEIHLNTVLDCSICREPLLVGPSEAQTSLPHLPTPVVLSSPHVAVHDVKPTADTTELDAQGHIITTTASTDNHVLPEPAVRLHPCNHIFGRVCLTAWFTYSKSNRCPECNKHLFPDRHMQLFLCEPTRSMRIEFAKYIEEFCGDSGTAEEIRSSLMSDWTRSLIREFAMELWRQQGYEVGYQYVVGGEAEQEQDEDEDISNDDDEEVDDTETDESRDRGGNGPGEEGTVAS